MAKEIFMPDLKNPFAGYLTNGQIGPMTKDQTKHREIMGGVYYHAITEDDNKPSIQKRLVAQVNKISQKYKRGWTVSEPPGVKSLGVPWRRQMIIEATGTI